ncbi:MAG: thiamine phosphate synthase [Acidimicrobiia bacterium]|nr:thiamine phosphate synthase [Acidimicrobiia bacterium]
MSQCLPVKKSLPRLYAISDVDVLVARGLDPLDVCDAWLEAGVRLIQLRAKSMASGSMLTLAEALVVRTRAAGATLIVNDRADIAAQCGADGVHVGQDDLSPADVRLVVGAHAIVGLSTHTDAQVADAVTQPVSYVAMGPVFGTSTKITGYDAVGLDQVARAAAIAHAAGKSLVAIGGMTRANAASALAAGADSVAVISDLVGDGTENRRGLAERARAWMTTTV